jgi:hypothetical protein
MDSKSHWAKITGEELDAYESFYKTKRDPTQAERKALGASFNASMEVTFETFNWSNVIENYFLVQTAAEDGSHSCIEKLEVRKDKF